ncbi:CAP domain-containing protein [Streptomyces sp. NPDC058417]|uniref:CAP domain-containing protein n=1 Tax=unclassified Streptomyces TaxID=2593676 RepID=UPI003646AE05
MGRHRRSAAGPAATGRAAGSNRHEGGSAPDGAGHGAYGDDLPTRGIAPYLNPEAYADSVARSEEYLFAPEGPGHPDGSGHFVSEAFASEGFTPDGGSHGGGRGGPGRRRKRKAVTPVKTGLLGVSAAVALGTVAVATGVVPGLDNYQLGGGGGGDRVTAGDVPRNSAAEQGGTSGSADPGRDGTPTGRAPGGAAAPSTSAPGSPTPSASEASPSAPESEKASPSASERAGKKPTEEAKPEAPARKSEKPTGTPSREQPRETPSRAATAAPPKAEAPVTVSAEAQAAAEVLKLVNEERAKVGCSALAANSSLTGLAQDFSADMAARGFFDHTDPDGASPWDRAAKAGITGLGGENIARGQADAAAVMEAWMNSAGHRANILNCDFKTLGVGVHLGSGGPWWTQDFGF